MGAPMVRRLCTAGLSVTAWNRDSAKAAPLAAEGAMVVDDLARMATAERVVMVMLSTGDVVDGVLFSGAAGAPVMGLLAPGSTVIVMSSIPVGHARAQAARLADAGVHYIDAPVSGGEAGAITGTLSIMAGGDSDLLAKLDPVFAPLGRLTHVGPVGSGSLAKLANQMIVGITIGAVAEALSLVELGGADLGAVRQALAGGFAGSTVLERHGARMIERAFAPGAHIDTQIKDLDTALTFGAEAGGAFPLLALCAQLFHQMADAGAGALDHSALYLDARRRAGLEKGAPPSWAA